MLAILRLMVVLSFVVANFIHDINRGLQYDKEPVSSPKLSQSENNLYIDELNQFDGLYIKILYSLDCILMMYCKCKLLATHFVFD